MAQPSIRNVVKVPSQNVFREVRTRANMKLSLTSRDLEVSFDLSTNVSPTRKRERERQKERKRGEEKMESTDLRGKVKTGSNCRSKSSGLLKFNPAKDSASKNASRASITIFEFIPEVSESLGV